MSNIYDKIAASFYTNTEPYPKRPEKPSLLRKAAGDLSRAELAELPAIKEAYEVAQRAYKREADNHEHKQGSLTNRFWHDLNSHFGLTEGGEFANTIRGIAWERGHAGGFGDVVSVMEDLIPLWDIYKRDVG